MPESAMVASRALREALAALEPELVSGDDCATLAEELARTAKACVAAQARLASRAADAGAHHRRGYASAADWLARTAGSSTGQARAALGTAAALGDCPTTNQAVVAGELSLAQAEEITRTEAACPGTEAELVALARGSSLGVLRDTARARRHRAIDPEDLHARQRAARGLRHWRDDLGMVQLAGALPPEVGIPIVSRLDAETDRIRKVARGQGSDEPRAAHAADALVALLAGHGRGASTRADLVIVWQRPGDGGEGTAHIVGGGPIPTSVARRLAERAFVKAVVHDGVRIETVKHVGRYIPAELRTALELGDPPDFDGLSCVDCGKRYGIERDHVDPVANGGPTSRDNITGRCYGCHQRKTDQDRQAGLLGNGSGGNGNGGGRGGREPP
jgi:5-methylcytosine-specific restriction endonuclease McrA